MFAFFYVKFGLAMNVAQLDGIEFVCLYYHYTHFQNDTTLYVQYERVDYAYEQKFEWLETATAYRLS